MPRLFLAEMGTIGVDPPWVGGWVGWGGREAQPSAQQGRNVGGGYP